MRRAVPADATVLPAHDGPFPGLHRRIDALAAHHAERLEATFDACDRALSGVDLVSALFDRALDSHQLFFALGESLAHVHRLEALGRVARERDAMGVIRFRAIS